MATINGIDRTDALGRRTRDFYSAINKLMKRQEKSNIFAKYLATQI